MEGLPPQTSLSYFFSNNMQDLEESSIPHHQSDETIARRRLLSQPQRKKDYLSRYTSSCCWLAEVSKDCFANPTGEIPKYYTLLIPRTEIAVSTSDPRYFYFYSCHAKDLTTKLLKVNPVERMSADDILRHPWQVEEYFANPNEGLFVKL